VASARALSQRCALVDALRVQALVAARQGRWAVAKGVLDEGLGLARAMPYPYGEARLLQADGTMRALQGQPGPAREHLETALTLFRRLGARKEVERTQQALASLSQYCPPQPPCTVVTDVQWTQIQALFQPSRHRPGRPRADDRRTLEAILYVQRTGCAWADLPRELGDDATAHRRFQRWQAEGIWTAICHILGPRTNSA
jgi:hypothetical protein